MNTLITPKRVVILLTILVAAISFHYSVIWITLQQKFYTIYYHVTAPTKTTSGSRVDTVYFFSPTLKAQRSFTAYIPAEYNSNPNKKYPVLYLLHGDPGNERDWLVNANLATVLNDSIRAHTITPLIVIMPNGNGPEISASQYVNATTQRQEMETFITNDLRLEVERRYRTIKAREGRAIGGNSSGGYGAANIGLRNNDLFSIILCFGAYFNNWHNELKPVFNSNEQAIADNSPSVYIGKKALHPKTYIYLMDGNQDWSSLIEGNKMFSELLTQQGIPNKLVLINGIHSWTTWSKGLHEGLTFINDHIAR